MVVRYLFGLGRIRASENAFLGMRRTILEQRFVLHVRALSKKLVPIQISVWRMNAATSWDVPGDSFCLFDVAHRCRTAAARHRSQTRNSCGADCWGTDCDRACGGSPCAGKRRPGSVLRWTDSTAARTQ